MEWKHVLAGIVIGAFIGMVGTFLLQERRTSRLETRVESQTKQVKHTDSMGRQEGAKADPEDLIAIVREEQGMNVRESWGEHADQCFSDNDLASFVRNNRVKEIADSLRHDPRFLDVVLAIRGLDPGGLSQLLASAAKPLRPTWAELGKVSREGQTEAGRQAEMMIANGIVVLVKQLAAMPEAEFKGLYR